MNELAPANAFLDTLLKEDTLLAAEVGTRIYADSAPEPNPEEAVYPLVLYNFMAATDVKALGARRIYTNPLYQVRAEGRAGYGGITAAANRIDAVLDGARSVEITIDSVVYVIDCVRERPVQLPPEIGPGGRKYVARGGLYRLYIAVSA